MAERRRNGLIKPSNFLRKGDGEKSNKLEIPRIIAIMASLLTLTVTGWFGSEVSVIEALQNWQTWISSGFSLPHFGQFICIDLIY
jgi:hypothetical protein